MACIKIKVGCYGDLWKAIEELEMAKMKVDSKRLDEGRSVKGGSTMARVDGAKKVEKADMKKGEKNETKKSSPANKVTASKKK